MLKTPILYIVATPIGNLADITYRAVEVLKSVDMIAAEDTRHSRVLLDHYQITTPMIALHGDNEKTKTKQLLESLQKGSSVALITDAGTPLISDPGTYLVQTVRASGVVVTPIPGPCALIAALSVSGLSTKRFHFEGFLPHKDQARRLIFESLIEHTATLVFYESRHHIIDFLTLAGDVFGGDRHAVVARELTKQFETVCEDTLAALHTWIVADPNQQKGEYVVLISGLAEKPISQTASAERILSVLSRHFATAEVAKITAEIMGGNKRDYYQRALELKK